jgi:hypothetical protein
VVSAKTPLSLARGGFSHFWGLEIFVNPARRSSAAAAHGSSGNRHDGPTPLEFLDVALIDQVARPVRRLRGSVDCTKLATRDPGNNFCRRNAKLRRHFRWGEFSTFWEGLRVGHGTLRKPAVESTTAATVDGENPTRQKEFAQRLEQLRESFDVFSCATVLLLRGVRMHLEDALNGAGLWNFVAFCKSEIYSATRDLSVNYLCTCLWIFTPYDSGSFLD